MQEHPSQEQLRQYQRRTLAPDLFLSVHEHVSACPVCSEQCGDPSTMKEDYENLLAALMPDPSEEAYHLTRAELAGYAQGNLDEVAAEVAAGHVELCAECAREAEELRAAAAREKRHKPWTSFPAFLTSIPRPARVASLTLMALVLMLAAIFFLRTRENRTAQSPENHDEGASPNANANQPVAIPSPTQTPLPRIADGGQQEGPAEVESLPPHLRRAVKAALTTQRLERPAVLAGLNSTKGTLLGDGGDGLPFRLLSPVGKVIQSSRPTFSWKPLAGADHYVVTIADGNLDEVATSGTLTKTAWTAPTPLKRGGTYSWQVTAYKDGKAITSPVMPAPPAKFVVLDQASNEELSRVRRSLPEYHLGLGVLYARAGLLDEAEREFQAELKSNPRSTVARRLLQSLREMKK